MKQWEKDRRSREIKREKECHYLLLKKRKSEDDYIIVKKCKKFMDAIKAKEHLLTTYPFCDPIYGLDWEMKIMSITQIEYDKNLSYLLTNLV